VLEVVLELVEVVVHELKHLHHVPHAIVPLHHQVLVGE
jgi:hypothetical protein